MRDERRCARLIEPQVGRNIDRREKVVDRNRREAVCAFLAGWSRRRWSGFRRHLIRRLDNHKDKPGVSNCEKKFVIWFTTDTANNIEQFLANEIDKKEDSSYST